MSGHSDDVASSGAGREPEQPESKRLTPEAERALKEAAERRAQKEALEHKQPAQQELGGRGGPDPVRFGDWENGGIASDF